MALVTILFHFPFTRVYSCSIIKMPLDKLRFLTKPEIRLELELEQ